MFVSRVIRVWLKVIEPFWWFDLVAVKCVFRGRVIGAVVRVEFVVEGYFVTFANVAWDVRDVWGYFEALDGADAHAEERDEWSIAVLFLAFKWDDPVDSEGDSGFFGFGK